MASDEEITGSLLQKMLEKQERMFGQMAVIMDRLAKRLDQIEDRENSLDSVSTQTETTDQTPTGPRDDPFEVEPQRFSDPTEVRETLSQEPTESFQKFPEVDSFQQTVQQDVPEMGFVQQAPPPPQEPLLPRSQGADDPFDVEPIRPMETQQLDTQWTDEIPGLKIQHTRDGIIGVYDAPQDTPQDVDEIQRMQAFAKEEQWNSMVKLVELHQKFIYQHDVRIERLYDALRARQ